MANTFSPILIGFKILVLRQLPAGVKLRTVELSSPCGGHPRVGRHAAGVRKSLFNMPSASVPLVGRGQNAQWSDKILQNWERGIYRCIPSGKSQKVKNPQDRKLHAKCHATKNSFGCLKDWRHVPPL